MGWMSLNDNNQAFVLKFKRYKDLSEMSRRGKVVCIETVLDFKDFLRRLNFMV